MIINQETAIAYTETLDILKKLDQTDFEKIPKERITLFEKFKDREYKFDWNDTIPIEEQISKKTKVILANLFYKYIATEEEKSKILQKDCKEIWELEKQKSEIKINPLFEDKRQKSDSEKSQDLSLICVKDSNIFNRIILKIKAFFRR